MEEGREDRRAEGGETGRWREEEKGEKRRRGDGRREEGGGWGGGGRWGERGGGAEAVPPPAFEWKKYNLSYGTHPSDSIMRVLVASNRPQYTDH